MKPTFLQSKLKFILFFPTLARFEWMNGLLQLTRSKVQRTTLAIRFPKVVMAMFEVLLTISSILLIKSVHLLIDAVWPSYPNDAALHRFQIKRSYYKTNNR
jgi:hypothetical protein